VKRHLLFFLLVPFPVSLAQSPLTAEGATRVALAQNPGLRAARQIVAEAEARAKGTGRLANPELSLEVAGGRDFEGRVEAGFTQWFPVTSRLRWERKISTLQIEMARLEVSDQERQLAAAAQTAFVELAAAREAIALAAGQERAAETEAAALRQHTAEGLASSLAAGAGALATRELTFTKTALQAGEAEAASRLATLLGLPVGNIPAVEASLVLPAQVPSAVTQLDRADLRLAEAAVEAGDAEILLARSSAWQDVGVGVFAEGERNRDEPEGIDTEGLLGLRVSLPFPLWQNGRSKVEERQAGRRRLEQQLAALRLAAQNEAVASWRVMETRHEAARQAQSEIVPAARDVLRDTEAAHQRGEVDQSQVFRARERLAALERSALETRKAYHLARIQWLAATGRILARP